MYIAALGSSKMRDRDEVAQRVEAGVLPILGQAPGLKAYYVRAPFPGFCCKAGGAVIRSARDKSGQIRCAAVTGSPTMKSVKSVALGAGLAFGILTPLQAQTL